MKKFLVMVLLVTMMTMLVACNSGPATGGDDTKPEGEKTEWATGRVIGKNTFTQGAYAHDIMTKTAKVMLDGVGDSMKEFTAEGNISNLLNNVENMVNSGVDGALWWGVLDANYAVGPREYENAKIPFAFFDVVPHDPEILSDIEKMDYYSGSVSCNNFLMGQQMAKHAIADGCKKAIIFANEIGSPVALRAEAFQEEFEKSGGEIVEISHAAIAANAHVEAASNMLATHTDVDCIYAVGVDLALGVSSAAAKLPNRDIKIYTTDITPDSLDYLKEGSFSGLNGGHWPEVYLATALLLNNMDGHKIVDENGVAAALLINPVVVTPETAEIYQKFWIDEMPYSYENFKDLLYRNNPDVTYEDFKKAAENYTFENVLKNKVEEGKITAEELKEVGIDVE